MELSTDLPKYRLSACLFSIWLCANWPQAADAACTLIPTVGNDNFVCDSATSGPLTDLSGNNTLTFPANGTGRINGNVTFGTGADTVTIASGTVAGAVNQGDGADSFTIGAGQVTGALSQGNGIDDFVMSGGTVQSLAQGDGRDTFLMTGGTIVGAFEDGDVARMTGGSIGRVDMKLDNNLFEMSGGQILRNLVTGLGTDTIIVSGGGSVATSVSAMATTASRSPAGKSSARSAPAMAMTPWYGTATGSSARKSCWRPATTAPPCATSAKAPSPSPRASMAASAMTC